MSHVFIPHEAMRRVLVHHEPAGSPFFLMQPLPCFARHAASLDSLAPVSRHHAPRAFGRRTSRERQARGTADPCASIWLCIGAPRALRVWAIAYKTNQSLGTARRATHPASLQVEAASGALGDRRFWAARLAALIGPLVRLLFRQLPQLLVEPLFVIIRPELAGGFLEAA